MKTISAKEMATVVCSRSHQFKGMAMLKAFFDESGTHQSSRFVLIAGFIATEQVWTAIDDEWKAQLSILGVPYFHATECERGEGAFQGISRPIRDALYLSLTRILCKHKPMIIESVIERSSFDGMLGYYMQGKKVDPYHICFDYCVQQMCAWSDEYGGGEWIAPVFAAHQEYSPLGDHMFSAYKQNSEWGKKLQGISFYRTQAVPMLQLADLICYERYQYLLNRDVIPQKPFRPAFQAMLDGGVVSYSKSYDPAVLAAL